MNAAEKMARDDWAPWTPPKKGVQARIDRANVVEMAARKAGNDKIADDAAREKARAGALLDRLEEPGE